jgi:hypothetical protein
MTVMEQQEQLSNVDLERAVAALDKKIEDANADLLDWRAQGTDSNDALEQLREAHSRACTALAEGKGSADEPGKIEDRMRVVRARLVGIENVISERQTALEGLKMEIGQLHGEQTRRAQQRALVEEQQQTEDLIAEAEKALTTRDDAARRFLAAIVALRARAYTGEQARRIAADSAQSLERRAAGMRP